MCLTVGSGLFNMQDFQEIRNSDRFFRALGGFNNIIDLNINLKNVGLGNKKFCVFG